MKKNTFLIAALSLVMLFAASCAQVPQAELDAAIASVDSAKASEANRYLADEFYAIQDTLNAATATIEAESAKVGFSRSYDTVKVKLEKITADAILLKSKTEELKAQIRDEVQHSITELSAKIAEGKELLANAPKSKESPDAIEAKLADITIAEASLNEINTLINNGDYLTAKEKLAALKLKADAAEAELTAGSENVK
jgi:hypothetical protein